MKNVKLGFVFLAFFSLLILSCEEAALGGLGEGVDLEPPSLAITSPASNGLSFRTKDATSLMLSGTWDDNQAYRTPSIEVRWIEGNQTVNASVGNKTWQLDMLPAFNLGSLSSGSQNFIVTITDQSNNTNYATRYLLIDNGDLFVTDVSTLSPNGWYKAGDVLPLRLTFNKAATVTGTPRLRLNTGTDRFATYASGSGGTVLIFNFAVASGDVTSDLDYASAAALELNGGTIQNTGVNAVLGLPAPGSAGSLGNNKAIQIDTVAPSVSSVNSATANGTYVQDQTILI